MERLTDCCCMLCGNDFKVTRKKKKEMNGNFLCDACVKQLSQNEDKLKEVIKTLGGWITPVVSGFKAVQEELKQKTDENKKGEKSNDDKTD